MDDIEKAVNEYKRNLGNKADNYQELTSPVFVNDRVATDSKTLVANQSKTVSPRLVVDPLSETNVDLWEDVGNDSLEIEPGINEEIKRTVVRNVEFRREDIDEEKKTANLALGARDATKGLTLPLQQLRKSGFITPHTNRNRLTEEYRHIKRRLFKRINAVKMDEENNSLHNVIAVTSAVSGEGKTYSAINLAMSIALERERTVMLIDADVLKHSAGKIFGVDEKSMGLIDMLENSSVTPGDVILRTNIDRFTFIPAGRRSSASNELLAGEAMTSLVSELSRRYDDRIIVMDCPPVLQTNEASILADHAGQIVFVVAAELTRQSIVNQALGDIGDQTKVSVLLNKSRKRYGNYAHYGYEYK